MRPSLETRTAPARERGKGPDGDRSPPMERAVVRASSIIALSWMASSSSDSSLSNISSVVEESRSRRARISSSEQFTTAASGSSAAWAMTRLLETVPAARREVMDGTKPGTRAWEDVARTTKLSADGERKPFIFSSSRELLGFWTTRCKTTAMGLSLLRCH